MEREEQRRAQEKGERRWALQLPPWAAPAGSYEALVSLSTELQGQAGRAGPSASWHCRTPVSPE